MITTVMGKKANFRYRDFLYILINFFYSTFRVPNGNGSGNNKYMDEPKYMHAVTTIGGGGVGAGGGAGDEPKYTSCQMDDHAIKQFSTTNISVGGGCHPDDGSGGGGGSADSMTVIKSEDGVSHSYVLPPFLH